jgi:hypothetical protein
MPLFGIPPQGGLGLLPWQTIGTRSQMDWQYFFLKYEIAAMGGFLAGLLIFLVRARAGRQRKRDNQR